MVNEGVGQSFILSNQLNTFTFSLDPLHGHHFFYTLLEVKSLDVLPELVLTNLRVIKQITYQKLDHFCRGHLNFITIFKLLYDLRKFFFSLDLWKLAVVFYLFKNSVKSFFLQINDSDWIQRVSQLMINRSIYRLEQLIVLLLIMMQDLLRGVNDWYHYFVVVFSKQLIDFDIEITIWPDELWGILKSHICPYFSIDFDDILDWEFLIFFRPINFKKLDVNELLKHTWILLVFCIVVHQLLELLDENVVHILQGQAILVYYKDCLIKVVV